MTAAHTPGPWTVEGNAIAGADGHAVAFLSVRIVGTDDDPYIEREANARLICAALLFVKAAEAAIAYDAAIRQCANSPDTMASFCTAEGDDLDDLYAAWITASLDALRAAGVAT